MFPSLSKTENGWLKSQTIHPGIHCVVQMIVIITDGLRLIQPFSVLLLT